MKKILSFILSSIVALNLSISVANSAANEVRVAFFLEWPTPNQEDKVCGHRRHCARSLRGRGFGKPVLGEYPRGRCDCTGGARVF